MSFEALLNHRCDIYHIIGDSVTPGYGLPSSPSFSYSDMPDISGVPCHFGIRSGVQGIVVNQHEPMAVLEGRVKLALPLGTDIRLNDKVINTETGYEYTAEAPTKIREHHITVMLRRTKPQGYIDV